MVEDPRSFEELVSLHSEKRELFLEALARDMRPQCQNEVVTGYGCGRVQDSVFCSTECYAEFRAEIGEIYRPPERN